MGFSLTAYFLSYAYLKAMKGQNVADFVVDHAIVEALENYVELKPWRLYFDGSRHKNRTRVGILVISPKESQPSLNLKSKDAAKIMRLNMKP